MMVVDASTLILLAKAELLEKFLDQIAQEVVIPKEVERESCRVKKSFDALIIQRAISEKKIAVKAIKDRNLVAQLQRDFALALGEAEAIALAIARRARLVAIDDKSGINACKLLRVAFTTALAILVRMHEKGLIDRETATAKLGALERYGRYKADIVADARSRLEGD
jgi:predicted nucleic acid-binding protein